VRRAQPVFGRRDYIIELAGAAEVAATAAALAELNLAWLRERFDERVPPSEPGLVQADHSRGSWPTASAGSSASIRWSPTGARRADACPVVLED
jgi:hypothetical protein